ncbi:MAG: hypothetical protein EXX96DRAFT_651265 [Benjaminiella poitrasii]|nr:MAG: hypothetical protein EXX96DRAFT_651265 [Benjaminiella poitrasii]
MNVSRSNNRIVNIVPSEFEHWVESVGGEKELSAFINTNDIQQRRKRRRRRSLLSNMTYPISAPINDTTTTVKEEQVQEPQSQSQLSKKSSSWFTDFLFHHPKKPNNKSPIKKFSKQATIHSPQIPSLPRRYPVPIEHTICQLGMFKLSTPKRPLRQQVLISNLLVDYTSRIISLQQFTTPIITTTNIHYDNSTTALNIIPPRITSTSYHCHVAVKN